MLELEPRIFKQSQTTGRDSDERSEEEPMVDKSNEVIQRRSKRRFSAADKRRILAAADRCTLKGEIGALLRREGIYSSSITKWRALRSKGELGALSDKKRGRKPIAANPLAAKLAESEKQVRALSKKLDRAETIISFQKKFLEIFGKLPNPESDELSS